MALLNLLQRAEKIAVDNSPLILTTIGVVGTLTTAYLTGKASYRVGKRFAYEDMDHLEPTPRQRLKEIFLEEKLWTLYIPPFVTGVLTVAAIVTSNRVSSRRAAALATAYSISERAFEEYRDKIIQKLGPRKESEARDEIAQEKFTKGAREIHLGAGEVLCYDLYTGRTFSSDVETLRQAQNDINHQILHEMSASLTDFYYRIGLSSTAISDEVGWNVDRMLELRFTSVLTDQNKPAVAVGFSVSPIRNYHKIN